MQVQDGKMTRKVYISCTGLLFIFLQWSRVGAENIQGLYLDLFKNPSPGPDDSDLLNNSRIHGDFSKSCSRDSFYYSFSPDCQQNVHIVEQLLFEEENTTRLLELARSLRSDPQVHPKVWYSALTRVTMIREDLMGLWKPEPFNVIPEDFIDARAIDEAIRKEKESQSLRAGQEKKCVVLDETFAGGDQLERNLWYFREDLQINSHHWFWHNNFPPIPPSTSSSSYTPYHADRRGELFYYMHHHVMARYNAERLSNNLPLTAALDLRSGYVMQEPYIANLDDSNSGTSWTSRTRPTRLPDSVVVRSANGHGLQYTELGRTIETKNRIVQSIDDGYLQTSRGRVSLRNADGIDRLVDVTEASVFSLNLNYYGSMHSSGHLLIALAQDPSNPDAIPTVMADSGTSMRDFIFFNWHTMIDEMFDRHKKTLAPYKPTRSDFPLVFPNVIIDEAKVYNSNTTQPGDDDSDPPTANLLNTFWSYKKMTLSTGVGFDRNKRLPPVPLCVKHLNHEPFAYEIKMRSKDEQLATIRIFLAPRYDSNGNRFSLEQQRTLFFALDTFTTRLTAGVNIINRESAQSTLTVPWGESLNNMEQNSKRPYCGCGWPQHMLLPKGTVNGMVYDLFIMATNAQEDQTAYTESSESSCQAAPLLCGLPGRRKYPDTKPMGYPFDRSPYNVVEHQPQPGATSKGVERPAANLDEYVRFVPNAFTTQVTIKHEDRLQ